MQSRDIYSVTSAATSARLTVSSQGDNSSNDMTKKRSENRLAIGCCSRKDMAKRKQARVGCERLPDAMRHDMEGYLHAAYPSVQRSRCFVATLAKRKRIASPRMARAIAASWDSSAATCHDSGAPLLQLPISLRPKADAAAGVTASHLERSFAHTEPTVASRRTCSRTFAKP